MNRFSLKGVFDMRKSFLLGLMAALVLCAQLAHAQQQVRITVENLQPDDGFYLTPVWVGFHDGGFDIFNEGGMASASLEALAEEGDVSGVAGDFTTFGSGQSGVLANPAGFSGAPVLDPGETASLEFNLASTERFLTFASMIIPSNDGFFGNDAGIEVLDASGNFNFGGPIELSLADLWDSGTELNDGLGAPFSTTGGTSTDEANAIALHGGLDNLDGTGTPDGTVINFANASASPVLRITVSAIPEPGSLTFIGVLGCVGLLRRRRG